MLLREAFCPFSSSLNIGCRRERGAHFHAPSSPPWRSRGRRAMAAVVKTAPAPPPRRHVCRLSPMTLCERGGRNVTGVACVVFLTGLFHMLAWEMEMSTRHCRAIMYTDILHACQTSWRQEAARATAPGIRIANAGFPVNASEISPLWE